MNLIKSLNRAKDPSIFVGENLNYLDIESDIYFLTNNIVESNFLIFDEHADKFDAKKNIIIGIDRGGAIVGGMLAKNLGLAIEMEVKKLH
jgi:hypoxanthine phosphoribosyltransferase